MISTVEIPSHVAAAAFDCIADSYDDSFTRTLIGRAQRRIVWNALRTAFPPGSRVLELNCGTGEDASFLSRLGVSVVACDASPRMIQVARQRQAADPRLSSVQFHILTTENLQRLNVTTPFDGVLSNFSGLNCVADIRSIVPDLAGLTKPKAAVCICLSSRICIWEILWFASRANFAKAFRRLRGSSFARIVGREFPVWYPTIRSIKRSLTPYFRLRSIQAVGLAVPPTYVRTRSTANPKIISRLEWFDNAFGSWPVVRTLGDHVLLQFERVSP
jgi:2-polyprenyl-3-methyl-5-hydroxy-6-metoxy-1,4-benzoquinol methylase